MKGLRICPTVPRFSMDSFLTESDFPTKTVVIFTDGDGPYPDESEALGVPVLWIINNLRFTPPWGKVTRILPTTTRQIDE